MSKCLFCDKRLKKGRDDITYKICNECDLELRNHRVDLSKFVKVGDEK